MGEHLENLRDINGAFFRLLAKNLAEFVPRTKWFKSEDIREGDLVYFIKSESKFGHDWQLAEVDKVYGNKFPLEVSVRYKNSTEEIWRYSDRVARDLVVIHYVDELEPNTLSHAEEVASSLQEN